MESSGTAPPATPPLDAFTNAPRAAYSDWRRLLTSYSGALNRVRKTTGGDTTTQQDVPYAAATNLIDEASLSAFVGAQSWSVVTRYDQTAGARNVTQATGASQPVGGVSGVANKIGTRHACDFSGTTQWLARADALGLSGAVSLTRFISFTCDALPNFRYLSWLGGTGAQQCLLVYLNTTTSIGVSIFGSNRVFTCPLITSGSHKVLVSYTSGTGIGTARCWLDGVELSELSSLNPLTVMNLANSFYTHGAANDGSSALDGDSDEDIVWNAALGAAGNEADLARALAL